MKLKGKIIIGAMVLAAISGMQSMAAEKARIGERGIPVGGSAGYGQ